MSWLNFINLAQNESPTQRLVRRLVDRATESAGSINSDSVALGGGAEEVPLCLLEVQSLLNRMVYERGAAQSNGESSARLGEVTANPTGGVQRTIQFPNGLQVEVGVRGGVMAFESRSATGQSPLVTVDDVEVDTRGNGGAAPTDPMSRIKIASDGVFVQLDTDLQPLVAEHAPNDVERAEIDARLAKVHNNPKLRERYMEPQELARHIAASGKKELSFSGFVNSGYFDNQVLGHLLGQVLDGLDPNEYIIHSCGTDGIGMVAKLAKDRGFETTALRARIGDAQISPYVDHYTLAGYTWEDASQAFGEMAAPGHLVVIGGNRYSELEARTALQHGGSVTNVPYFTDEAGNLAGTHSLSGENSARLGVATNADGILQRILGAIK